MLTGEFYRWSSNTEVKPLVKRKLTERVSFTDFQLLPPLTSASVEVLVRNPTASDVILLHGWCPPNRFDKRILLGQEELKDSKESVA